MLVTQYAEPSGIDNLNFFPGFVSINETRQFSTKWGFSGRVYYEEYFN